MTREQIEAAAVAGRIDLPGGWSLVRDDEPGRHCGAWFLSTPPSDGSGMEHEHTGIWVAKFWDGPEAGEDDAIEFACSLYGVNAETRAQIYRT